MRGLYDAVLRHFGSFRLLVDYLGLDYEELTSKKVYTKEVILELIKEYDKQEVPLNVKEIQNINGSLYFTAFREFGSWENAITSAGLDYESIRVRKGWDKEIIKNMITEIYRKDPTLNFRYIRSNYKSLLDSAVYHFGSWEKAVEFAGISYYDVRRDKDNAKYGGRLFEKLLDDILKEVGVKFQKHNNGKMRPDYILGRGVWADAKLSEWTVFKSNTIPKYEPLCKMLLIIYYRGDSDLDVMVTPKTRLINVSKFIKMLPKARRNFYLKKLSELDEEIAKGA